jgi:hypothetical protein
MELKSESNFNYRRCVLKGADEIECYVLGFGGNYNVAIVEFDDGSVTTVTLDMIRFIDRN